MGTAFSMSVKGISCVIFPFVNGIIMGQEAGPIEICKVCLFMAFPCTLGFFLIIFFCISSMKSKSQKLLEKQKKELELIKNTDLTEPMMLPKEHNKKRKVKVDEKLNKKV